MKMNLRDLHLEESLSQTINGSLFKMDDIQESVSENDAVQPIAHNYDARNAESMKAAKVFAEKRLKELEGKSSPDVAALEAENENLRSKLDLIAQNAFEAKKAKLGAGPEDYYT